MTTQTNSPAGAEPRLRGLLFWRITYLAIQGLSSVAVVAIVSGGATAAVAGAFLVAQGTVVAIQTVADLGVSQAAATWLASARERDPQRADEWTGALLAGAVRVAVLATVAVMLAAALFSGDPAVAGALLLCAPLAGAALVLAALDGALRTEGAIRLPILLTSASRLGMVGGAALGVALLDTAPGIAAVCSAATVLATLPAFRLIWRRRGSRALWQRHRREVIAACLPIGASQLGVVLTARITTPLAAGLAGVIAAAAFEAAWRLFQVGQYALGGPLTALAPRIARERERGERHTLHRAVAACALVGGATIPIVLLLAGPVAELLAGDLAEPTARSLRILAIAVPFALVTLPAGFALAGGGQRERWTLAASAAIGAAANLVLTLLLRVTGWDPAVGPTVGVVLSGLLLTAAALRRPGAPAPPQR